MAFTANDSINDYDFLGLDRFVFSGGPMYQSDPEHDKTWRNYINAAEYRIQNQLRQLNAGEEILWVVEANSYQERGAKDIAEGITKLDYVAEIKKSADKFGNRVRLQFVSNKYALAVAFNTDPQTNQPRGQSTRSGAQFSQVDYFGHGGPGKLLPYTFVTGQPVSGKSNEWSFGSADLFLLVKSSITSGCRCVSYGCNSATDVSSSSPSFTSSWQDYFGVQMYGVQGKTTYGPTGPNRNPLKWGVPKVPGLDTGAKWVPEDPNPRPPPYTPPGPALGF